MDAASDGDVVLFVEFDHDLTRVVPIEVEEDDRGSAFDGGEPENGGTGDGLEPFEDSLGHGHLVFVDSGD